MRNYFATILLLGLLFFCHDLQAQSAADEQALAAFTQSYMSAYNAQDHSALQNMYTTEAVYQDVTGKEILGAASIGEHFASYFRNHNVSLQLQPSQVSWSDYQHAFVASGSFELTGRTIVYDIPVQVSGTYSNTMLQEDGQWKISHSVLTPSEE